MGDSELLVSVIHVWYIYIFFLFYFDMYSNNNEQVERNSCWRPSTLSGRGKEGEREERDDGYTAVPGLSLSSLSPSFPHGLSSLLSHLSSLSPSFPLDLSSLPFLPFPLIPIFLHSPKLVKADGRKKELFPSNVCSCNCWVSLEYYTKWLR